ncbi:leucine-rich repeat flightless-interacting protein 2 isoform X2 [Syngnathus acus]|uniref:leucine-rich repeat flightless-interacting protein 2 isoform X2 n=1 Tax=Syngnathus acus TaxID=161584 RepID=UPI0018861C30|nr:leucine-rich repeat flightless-interacting protein 2 isoform X2 [Syngnathus acus]
MGTQGPGRKRLPNQEKMTAEDDALQQIARDAEARLAARRTARAEAREIRMKELEKQHKEKYYGLDYKWGRIEQWMEDGERYSRHSRRIASLSDDEERMSVGSRGSLKVTTLHQSIPGSSSSSNSLLSRIFSFTSPSWHTSLSHLLPSFYPCTCSSFLPSQPSDYSSFLGSGSRASSRASSARASPVVEERLDRDFLDRGSRTALNLSAATLSSLGGASSRRGSCDTSVSVEMEASIREMKDSVAEAEEKYRRAMVSNAQLHNDKSTLMYQVETLREDLSDMEELLWEARRHADERTKAYERERDCHILLQFQFKEMNETMRRSEELLMEVSQLREQTHAYAQEVSDLQEALQWKEKKIAALERQREISDVIQIERDQLRVEVLSLRDVVKKYGEVISPELATNGGPRLDDDEVSNSFGENVPDSRESMLGNTGDLTSHYCPKNKPTQLLSFGSAGKHVRASNVSREARARKQMTHQGRRKNHMRIRLKGSCVSVKNAIAKQAVKQSGDSDHELTPTPKVKSPNEAKLSKKSQAKRKKTISHVGTTSIGNVQKSGQPASILYQKNIRSGNSADTIQRPDSNRLTGQKLNEKPVECSSAPTGVSAAEPSSSASLIREDCEDCSAKYQQRVIGNTAEKCRRSQEEADNINMSDFVFVDSTFAGDTTSPEDLLTKLPGSPATSATVGHSCNFTRFVEELKVMAAPEWVLLKLPEGKMFEEQRVSQILGTDMQATQEVADMDSCEEAHEEMEQ